MAHFKKTVKNSPETMAPKPVNILKDEGSSGNSSVANRISFFAMKLLSPPRLVKCRFYDDCCHESFAVTEK
jgi:hypothetical protein